MFTKGDKVKVNGRSAIVIRTYIDKSIENFLFVEFPADKTGVRQLKLVEKKDVTRSK